MSGDWAAVSAIYLPSVIWQNPYYNSFVICRKLTQRKFIVAVWGLRSEVFMISKKIYDLTTFTTEFTQKQPSSNRSYAFALSWLHNLIQLESMDKTQSTEASRAFWSLTVAVMIQTQQDQISSLFYLSTSTIEHRCFCQTELDTWEYIDDTINTARHRHVL